MPRQGSPRMPWQRRRRLNRRINEPFKFDFATISPSSEVQRQTRDETAMAIINTFQKCLDGPYLIEDKDAPARIGELLAKAGDRLEGSVNIQTTGQGDPADIVFLSYEAMFCCLRALVYAKGYREYGLRCLLLPVKISTSRPASSTPSTSASSSWPSASSSRRPTPSRPPPRSSSERSNCWGSKPGLCNPLMLRHERQLPAAWPGPVRRVAENSSANRPRYSRLGPAGRAGRSRAEFTARCPA